MAIVPRLICGLLEGVQRPPLGAEVWTDTRLSLPTELAAGRWRDVLTGASLTLANDGTLLVAEALAALPVALLVREREG